MASLDRRQRARLRRSTPWQSWNDSAFGNARLYAVVLEIIPAQIAAQAPLSAGFVVEDVDLCGVQRFGGRYDDLNSLENAEIWRYSRPFYWLCAKRTSATSMPAMHDYRTGNTCPLASVMTWPLIQRRPAISGVASERANHNRTDCAILHRLYCANRWVLGRGRRRDECVVSR